MSSLKLLFDSNVFYACINIRPGNQHQDSVRATQILELSNRYSCEVWLAKGTGEDIDNAQDPSVREASRLAMRQWKILEEVSASDELLDQAGFPRPLSKNDEVDSQMLAALEARAVDFLITQDGTLRQRVGRAGFGDQTMSIQGGIELLKQLFSEPEALPTVKQVPAYQLSPTDPIFDSLRDDYSGFDEWLDKARQEHRDCFVLHALKSCRADTPTEAVAILKTESHQPHGLEGKVLKICTLKVSDSAKGAKRGELLLKAVFNYASAGGYDRMYVEVFPKHVEIVHLLERFGFYKSEWSTGRGESVLVKDRRPPATADGLDPLAFTRQFGPPAVLVRDAFIIPVQPLWHDVLFPEANRQQSLFPPSEAGNAILKAYLSASPIRTVQPGSLILFYRSQDLQHVGAVGVVEETFRSGNPAEVRRLVGQRTVYTDRQISEMCSDGRSILAILFRHDRLLKRPWKLNLLIERGVVVDAPQSVQGITNEGALEWIRAQLAPPH